MHEALVRRREQRGGHRQQGELKAAERFGEVAGSLLGVDAVAPAGRLDMERARGTQVRARAG